jgi:Uncharacterized protein conserved in bacteria (DUF2252)
LKLCDREVTSNQSTLATEDDADAGEGRRSGARRVEHLTSAQRAARGKEARAEVPRSVHGAWQPPNNRPDPVDLLEEQAASRVPELVPIRYGRMLVSPFTFYRGAAYLMAFDLAGEPRTGLPVQLCGDAHLSNFGVFAAPDRRLVFSINDFDETLPGPFEWDVKRLAASFAVAGRDRGFDAKQREAINLTMLRSYREAMRNFATMKILELWYARLDVEEIERHWAAEVSAHRFKRFDRNLAKARAKDSLKAFDKLVRIADGQPRTRAPAIRWQSPVTSARVRRSTGPWPRLPRRTQTRTSGITRRLGRPSAQGRSMPKPGCSRQSASVVAVRRRGAYRRTAGHAVRAWSQRITRVG